MSAWEANLSNCRDIYQNIANEAIGAREQAKNMERQGRHGSPEWENMQGYINGLNYAMGQLAKITNTNTLDEG